MKRLSILLLVIISCMMISCADPDSKDYDLSKEFAIEKNILKFNYCPIDIDEPTLKFFRTNDEYVNYIKVLLKDIEGNDTYNQEKKYLTTMLSSYDTEYFKENMVFLYFEKQTTNVRNVTINEIFLKGNILYFDVKKTKLEAKDEKIINVAYLIETEQLAFGPNSIV